MAQIGRIGGPLLTDNLLRNGNDLAFETSLLYLKVGTNQLGVNTNAPSNDLTINGTSNVTNLIVTTDAIFGNLEATTNQIQNALSSIIFAPTGGSATITAPKIATANLSITGNTILNTTANSDINIGLTSATSGQIKLNNNVLVTGNLHATGNITFDGNIVLGDQPTDTIKFAADVGSDILPSVTLTDNLGSSSLNWNNLYVNNYNTNLATGNFTVSGNTIAGSLPNSTVYYTANGTGTVNTQYLNWSNNNITNIWPSPTTDTQRSIVFTPNGTGNVQINSAYAVVLPVGNDTNRTLTSNGEVRFNSTSLNIEGYQSTGYVNFFNLYSQDRLTYITPEITPGAADKTLRFAVNNVVTTTIDSAGIRNQKLISGNVIVSANTIQNTNGNNDLTFATNGTGSINLANFLKFSTNTLTNTQNLPLSFNSTGYGFYKFAGSNGIGIPVNTATNYTPPIGTIRYNTTASSGEVYTSTGWSIWTGSQNQLITRAQDQDLSILYTLMLGY